MAPAPTESQLAALWPNPGASLAADTPARWPGHTPETTATARKYLRQDFERHHGYFNYHGAHNHTPFHILVQWSLGGTSDQMDAIWQQHVEQERYAYESPLPITEHNFADHLGDEEYYRGYLYFFCDLLLKRSTDSVVQEWIFSSKANFASYNGSGKQAMMLNRLVGGILHPMLYLGYGMEFRSRTGRPVATHPATSSVLLPKNVFDHPSGGRSGVHAFTIAARILQDHRFANKKGSFDNVQKNLGADIQRYASEWSVDGSNPKEVASKVRELTFLNVMLYVVGGWRDGEGFHIAEFTLMHLLTSSMTLTSYMASLSSPTSKSLLLRAYLTRSLAYYISRGRPNLPIRSFFSTEIDLAFPDPPVYPSEMAYPSGNTPNIWLKIIQSALVHPDDHLSKVQRTLAHYGALYGSVQAGEFAATGLEDSGMIDGTLFVRAATLTARWMGRIREGGPARYWGGDPNFPESEISERD